MVLLDELDIIRREHPKLVLAVPPLQYDELRAWGPPVSLRWAAARYKNTWRELRQAVLHEIKPDDQGRVLVNIGPDEATQISTAVEDQPCFLVWSECRFAPEVAFFCVRNDEVMAAAKETLDKFSGKFNHNIVEPAVGMAIALMMAQRGLLVDASYNMFLGIACATSPEAVTEHAENGIQALIDHVGEAGL